MKPARELTVTEATDRMRAGDLTARALVASCMERIRQREDTIHAWVQVHEDEAMAAADRCDRELKEGNRIGMLHGIPVGVKDIIDVEGMWTRAGCEVYPARVAERDAPVVRRLRAAGAIILGKTHTTAFANNDPAITRNPWNPEHTPGGSSSGSAAGVADRMCPAALGSQTGGSLIRPAAYNGIVGFKPTNGYVSLEGVIPVSWGLDSVGPHTRCLEDAVRICRVIREEHPDPFLRVPPAPGVPKRASGGRPPRLGFFPEYLVDEISAEMADHLESVRRRFETAGAEVVNLALPPSFEHVASAHRTLFDTDLACYHRTRFAADADRYPPNIRARIDQGMKIPGHRYADALRRRAAFQCEIFSTLATVDAGIMAASLSTAPLGLASTGSAAANLPWSLAGSPAITLPAGLDARGLPFGVQFVGLPWEDDALASVAAWCEPVLDFRFAPEGVNQSRG